MIPWPPIKNIVSKKNKTKRYFKEMTQLFLTSAGATMFLLGAFCAFAATVIFGHY